LRDVLVDESSGTANKVVRGSDRKAPIFHLGDLK
jgi:hypothetical protein